MVYYDSARPIKFLLLIRIHFTFILFSFDRDYFLEQAMFFISICFTFSFNLFCFIYFLF